jgi:hypothetical protein
MLHAQIGDSDRDVRRWPLGMEMRRIVVVMVENDLDTGREPCDGWHDPQTTPAKS